ncbi:carboxylating nicotinate-nucleotide diphosphorylase [Bacillus mangrovi]|uniref:Probable nicotinate-nucleotide pyrophosphorylase [carboxylating] n=1 Tax=Metabacillus mangrovi TaxID=1491830 RepID=A0A7X2S3T6_9BACI|nr:carboxylating nicotinate-nucleotide diphosphorylase [Metabacillus mangrovi]MTH53000.1 carboxylating nicotinate-nucleotide diphosphorylase [Metabacillus mangrovi]
MNRLKVEQKIREFLLEDLGDRDATSEAIFSDDAKGEAVIYAKETGVFAGEAVLTCAFSMLDPSAEITVFKKDGETIEKGEAAAAVKATIRSILGAERTALNLLQRMSGIATMTSEAVKKLDSPETAICDTRKTAPGLRMFDKYAVRCGGGSNHRFGLHDAIMIKDNHISFAGSIRKAVAMARRSAGHAVKIEVEIETEEQLLEAIEAKADIIMFDNRTPAEVKRFAELTPSPFITEASGGIDVDNISMYRGTGVQYISLGCLTHSVRALDFSLLMKQEETKHGV